MVKIITNDKLTLVFSTHALLERFTGFRSEFFIQQFMELFHLCLIEMGNLLIDSGFKF